MESGKVYAIWDYWDGIRSGFADFRGAPHYFEAEWNEADDDYLPTFTLKLINQTTLDLVLEWSRIFRAWELQFHQGLTAQDTHPAVPGQNPRFVDLSSEIRNFTDSAAVTASGVVGTFEALEGQEDLPPGVFREVRVAWQAPPSPRA